MLSPSELEEYLEYLEYLDALEAQVLMPDDETSENEKLIEPCTADELPF